MTSFGLGTCDFDVLTCLRGGRRLRVIATVQDPLAVQAILAYWLL